MIDRFRTFSVWIVVLAVSLTIFLDQKVFSVVTTNLYFRAALVWLSGVLTYEVIVKLLFSFGGRMKIVLAAYYGKFYLHGYWHYTSRNKDNKMFLGVWKIEQDLYETRVTAFGLDDKFGKRSSVHSTACVLSPERMLFINERTDFNEDPNRDLFSKTTAITAEMRRRLLVFRHPIVLLGETELFGGGRSGEVNTNVVLRKHPEIDSFEALIKKLRSTPNVWTDQR
jgi:hypothetical protein